MPPAPVGGTVVSAIPHTLVIVKSLSRVNVTKSADLLGRLTCGTETLKLGTLVHDENLYCPDFSQIRQGASARESMKGVEVHIGGNLKDGNCEELISK